MWDAIEYLITHPERRRALESAARAAAERTYNWDLIARRQQEIYESLMNAAVSSPSTRTR
jgi:glycosyltransferase involved in cell wall biosynthesis